MELRINGKCGSSGIFTDLDNLSRNVYPRHLVVPQASFGLIYLNLSHHLVYLVIGSV
jgi:hypothetical protein